MRRTDGGGLGHRIERQEIEGFKKKKMIRESDGEEKKQQEKK